MDERQKRKGNGDGSTYKDKAGRWHAILQLSNGKRIHRSAMTWSEVKRKLRDVQRDHEAGLPVPDQRVTVKDYLEAWLTEVVTDVRRDRTTIGYASHVRVHIVPSIGHIALARLTVSDVERMLRNLKHRRGGRPAPGTTLSVRATLRNALNRAEARGYIARNVAKLATIPTVEPHDAPPIGVDEAEAILAAVREHRLAPLFEFALYTGLRMSELAGLRWGKDVDLDAGSLRLGEQLQRITGKGFVRGRLKSAKASRTLHLPPIAIDVLRRQRVLQAEERLMAGGTWIDQEGLVFTSRRGSPLDSSTTRTLGDLTKNAGLPTYTMHDLRRGCATILLARGVPPHVVQRQLGHSDVELTMGVYAKVTAAMAADAADAMQVAFGASKARRSVS